MKSALRWSFVAVLAAATAWYIRGHKELLLSLQAIPPPSIALLLCLALSEVLLQGIQLRQFCKAFDLSLPFKEWFGLTACNGMYDYFLPGRAATGVRAYYLKKRHGLAYAHFGSIFVVSNVLNLSVCSLVGAVGCLLWSLRANDAAGGWAGAIIALLAVPILGAVTLILLPGFSRRLPFGRFKERIEGFSSGMERLFRRANLLISGTAVQLPKIAASAAGYYVCCRAIGAEISVAQAVIVQCIGAFAILLPLTPAGLGIKEGFVSYLSYLVGLPADLAMLAALIQRAASMVVAFGFGLYFSHSLTRELDSDARGSLQAAAGAEQSD